MLFRSKKNDTENVNKSNEENNNRSEICNSKSKDEIEKEIQRKNDYASMAKYVRAYDLESKNPKELLREINQLDNKIVELNSTIKKLKSQAENTQLKTSKEISTLIIENKRLNQLINRNMLGK